MLVVAFDQRERRGGRAAAREHFGGGGPVLVGLLAVAIIFRGDFVALGGVVAARVEAARLLFERDVQPELDQHYAAVHQLVLELVDLLVRALPLDLAREAFDALDQNPAVPAAIEDGDPAAARQMPPKAPQIVVCPLFVGRRRDGDDPVAARVERPGDAPNRAALAGRVWPFEQQDRALVALAELLR